jgi:hypothetical protein
MRDCGSPVIGEGRGGTSLDYYVLVSVVGSQAVSTILLEYLICDDSGLLLNLIMAIFHLVESVASFTTPSRNGYLEALPPVK